MYTKLSKKRAASLRTEGPLTRERTERDLAWCAGTEEFQRRDPLYHVTEDFCSTFNRIGRQRAARMAAESGAGFSENERQDAEERRNADGRREASTRRDGRQQRPAGTWETGLNTPMQHFSDMAFQRGNLSASVLAGTGKLMLISCLKRTVGQSAPKRLQERSVLGIGSQKRNVPAHDPDQMIFNRGFTNSAVGLVVDTLRDARRTVESMAEMAEGVGEMGWQEGGTLRAMYPFLDSSRESALLEEYSSRLEASQDPRERAVLQNAIVKAGALKAKKAQMKNEFINKLRNISDRAAETLAELERPGAEDEILNALLMGNALFDADSQEEGDGDADSGQEGADAPDTAEDGDAPEDGAGPGEDPEGEYPI